MAASESKRDVELLDSGSVDPGKVGDRPGHPVHAYGAATGQLDRRTPRRRGAPSPLDVSGQRSRSIGPGTCTLRRHGMPA